MIQGKPGQAGEDLERQLFIVRKLIERAKTAAMGPAGDDFYVCTLSNRTIVYKGMLRSVVVGQFFKDLVNPDFETAFAIYHRWVCDRGSRGLVCGFGNRMRVGQVAEVGRSVVLVWRVTTDKIVCQCVCACMLAAFVA